MNTSQNKFDTIERIIFEKGLRIQSLDIHPQEDVMYVHLNNGHLINVRVSLFKTLRSASPQSLQQFVLIANGTGIHWPQLDEDLSLKGFLKDFLLQKIERDEELVIG